MIFKAYINLMEAISAIMIMDMEATDMGIVMDLEVAADTIMIMTMTTIMTMAILMERTLKI